MAILYPCSCADAAKIIGCAPSTVSRWAVRRNIGRVLGTVRLLSEDDVATLSGLVRETSGNPNFVAGNRFGKPPKKSRRKTGK